MGGEVEEIIQKKNEPKKSERTKLVEFIKKANRRLELKNKKGSSSDRKRKMVKSLSKDEKKKK
jgi:hypothetical protein